MFRLSLILDNRNADWSVGDDQVPQRSSFRGSKASTMTRPASRRRRIGHFRYARHQKDRFGYGLEKLDGHGELIARHSAENSRVCTLVDKEDLLASGGGNLLILLPVFFAIGVFHAGKPATLKLIIHIRSRRLLIPCAPKRSGVVARITRNGTLPATMHKHHGKA